LTKFTISRDAGHGLAQCEAILELLTHVSNSPFGKKEESLESYAAPLSDNSARPARHRSDWIEESFRVVAMRMLVGGRLTHPLMLTSCFPSLMEVIGIWFLIWSQLFNISPGR
jgi:hypothetical protein